MDPELIKRVIQHSLAAGGERIIEYTVDLWLREHPGAKEFLSGLFNFPLRLQMYRESKDQRFLADPWKDSIPKYVCREGVDFIRKQHIGKTTFLTQRARKRLYRDILSSDIRHLELFAIRARSLVSRTDLRDFIIKFLSSGTRRHLSIFVTSPLLTSANCEYDTNIRAEARFLVEHPDRAINAQNLRVNTNMVADQLAHLLSSKRYVWNSTVDGMAKAIAPFDSLSRRMYALAEIEIIKRLIMMFPGKLAVSLLNSPITYRGFRAKRFVTIQVSLKDKPGLLYSELYATSEAICNRVDDEIESFASKVSKEITTFSGASDAQNELFEAIKKLNHQRRILSDDLLHAQLTSVRHEAQAYKTLDEFDTFDKSFATIIRSAVSKEAERVLQSRQVISERPT